MEAAKKREFSFVKNKEDVSNTIQNTKLSTGTRQKPLEEIEIILDDMISKIINTFEQMTQNQELAMDKTALLKELNKPLEIFKRIKNINISQCLDGKRRVNALTSEAGSILKGALILSESVEDCVKAVIENIIKNVGNGNPQSEQSLSIRNVAANETEVDFIGFGEKITKEKNMVEEIENFLNNLIKEVQKSLIDSCLELTNKEPVKELELSKKLLGKTCQQTLPKTIQKPINRIKESLQNSPHRSDALSFSSDISTDCRQKPNMLKDCFPQKNMSTDSLQQNNLTDCSPLPNLPLNSQLSYDLQLNIMSTDYMEQMRIYSDSLKQSTPVSSGQHASTTAESLHHTGTQADSFQHASTSTNSLKHAHTPVPSLTEEIMMDRYLSDIIKTAHQVLNHQVNSNHKARRAATLVQSISDRSRQSNTHQILDNLLEVQNMIEIIDGIGDLNEYLHMDIRKIFLIRRDLVRIFSYVYEHLATILMCRSKKFIKKEAGAVTQIGYGILADIKITKSQIFSLFKNYFLIQRSFLKQSLKISCVPYEWLVGDGRFTLSMNRLKISVIRLCGTIFGIGDLEELYQKIVSNCREIERLVNVFTELAVVADHTQDTKMDTKVNEE